MFRSFFLASAIALPGHESTTLWTRSCTWQGLTRFWSEFLFLNKETRLVISKCAMLWNCTLSLEPSWTNRYSTKNNKMAWICQNFNIPSFFSVNYVITISQIQLEMETYFLWSEISFLLKHTFFFFLFIFYGKNQAYREAANMFLQL